ncbi:hypothetical protein HZH68_004259 [Vespula germanica]|uniref:RRM domain-containing protein n=1 Tax=Vespula germanica TaxID=30212 RepID=A0A834NJM1_VESGE|nr:hypothetical protein HZH68_004259 [Vespula germanica]
MKYASTRGISGDTPNAILFHVHYGQLASRSRNEPYAFVEYADHESASAALGALHQRHFLDKILVSHPLDVTTNGIVSLVAFIILLSGTLPLLPSWHILMPRRVKVLSLTVASLVRGSKRTRGIGVNRGRWDPVGIANARICHSLVEYG